MKIKTKIIIFIVLLLIGLPVGIFFSWGINALLTGNTLNISDFNIAVAIEQLKTDEKFRQLTLCVELIITAGISAILLIKKRESYESDTVAITNNIRTPIAIGQGQHGTAWWLNKTEYTRTFARYKLKKDNETFTELLRSGTAARKEIEKLLNPKIEEKERRKRMRKRIKFPAVRKAPKLKTKIKNLRDKIKANDTYIKVEKIISIAYKLYIKFVRVKKLSGGLVVHYEKHGKTEQIYYLAGDVHSLTIGTTGCGKSRCLVLQSIAFTALSGESMLITDPKGELADYCTLYLKNLGYEVICLGFKNPLNQHYIALTEVADKRGGRLERRVNFWLDEFGNFTVIPAFANMLTVSIGRGIRFNLFVQSLGQIEEKYGREGAQIIADNCHCWIYLKTADGETAAKISKRLGHYTTSSYSRSSSYAHNSGGNSSNSMNLIARSLLTEDEIMLIERPYALVMYTGKRPAVTRLPDLSKWQFNSALGLGNETHNIKLREVRENSRVARDTVRVGSDGTLHEIWKSYENGFPVQESKPVEDDSVRQELPNLPNVDHTKFDNAHKYGDLAAQIIEDDITDTNNQLTEKEQHERWMNL